MKVLVLLSGGVDSATCLAMAVKEHGKDNVTAVGFQYGQKHARELEAAAAVARHYGVSLITLDLTQIFAYSDCPLLLQGADIPKGGYEKQKQEGEPPPTYVPFRNGLFLSAAASVALSLNCDLVMYGAHSGDSGNAYPDCSEAFNNAMNSAIYEGSGHKLQIQAPFIGKTKAEVVTIGQWLKVPYELTWSCYEGGETPCGKCATCLDREEAFRIAKMMAL